MNRYTRNALGRLVNSSQLPVRRTVGARYDCIQTNTAEALIRRGYAYTVGWRDGHRWIAPSTAGVIEARRS